MNGLIVLTDGQGGPAPSRPGYIDGSVEPEAHGHFPPFIDGNGNLYRITEEQLGAQNNPQMLKSTDGGITWGVVDQAGQPTGTTLNDMEGGWSLQAGTSILLGFTDDTIVAYFTFNTSDAPTAPDTWQLKESAFTLTATSGERAHMSIARLSDGKVRAVYQDAPSGTNHQLAVSTKSTTAGAGGWSAKTVLTPTTSSYTSPSSVVGAADKLHILFHDFTGKTVQYLTLTAADVLSAQVRVDTAGTNTSNRNFHAVSNPVYYANGAAEVIAALYASAAGVRLIQIVDGVATDELVDSANPTIAPDNAAAALTNSDAPIMHLAVDGTTLHMVMSDGTTGDLVHRSRPHGGAWSARTVLWDSGTSAVHWLYNNVYTRAGVRVMGYTYDVGPHLDDEAFIRYNELTLIAATNASAAGSVTLGGSVASRAATSVAGSVTLAGSGSASAPASAGGSITLGGSAAASAPATSSGSISLAGSTSAAAPLSAGGSITLGASAAAAAPTSGAGSITLGGSATPAAQTSNAGGVTLGGTTMATAPATGGGAITLGGVATSSAPTATTGGEVTLSGSTTASGSPTASGGVTLGGTTTATVPATPASATGSITLTGATSAATPAAAVGSIDLGGSANAATPAASQGAIALGGAAASAAQAATAGSITLGGSANAATPASATGSITLGGSASTGGSTPATGAGSITLGGNSAVKAAASLTGGIILGAATSATPFAATSGVIVIGGAVTVAVPATAAGLIALSGLANATDPHAVQVASITVTAATSPTLTVSPGSPSLVAAADSPSLAAAGASPGLGVSADSPTLALTY